MLRRHKKRDDAQGFAQPGNDGVSGGVAGGRTGRATPGAGSGSGHWMGMTSSSSSLSGLYHAGSGSGSGSNASNNGGAAAAAAGGAPGAHPMYMQGAGQNSSSSSITRASGRAFDMRRQTSSQQQQQQPLVAPPSFTASHAAAQQQQQQQQQQQRANVDSSSKYGMPPSRHRHLAASPSIDALGSSSSPPGHPGPSSPSTGQQSPGAQPIAQMGRSQSTLNFLLSKAKNPFSSSSSSSQPPSHSSHHAQASSISTSASIASFQGPSEEQLRKESALGRHRTASASSTNLPQGAVPIDYGDAGANALGRSFGDDSSGVGSPSPVKRSLFGRDRKTSTTPATTSGPSSSRNNERSAGPGAGTSAARSGLSSYNPIARRGGRQDGGSSNYAFSKSQSDLHARQDFPSPGSAPLDLPRVNEVSEQSQRGSPDSRGFGAHSPSTNAISSIDTGMLRSPPTSNAAFSRSVDDLSRSHTPEPARNQASAAARQRGQYADRGASSGESARTGDAPARRTGWPQNAGTSAATLSSAPSSQSNASVPSGRGGNAGVSPDAASGSSATQGNDGLRVAAKSARKLPPGVTFEGFLNRNVNLSLSIAQLSENQPGRGVREKDISKGWKPFKVILRDGKLLFYKPPNAVADELKNVFPTTVVADASTTPFGEQGISIEDIRRNKVNTQDLLTATSESTQTRPMARRMPSSQSFASLSATDTNADAPRDWQRPGHHRDLVLSSSLNEPTTWLGRVRGGSLEALAHEFAFATQANGTPSREEASAFFYALVFTHVFRAQRPLQSLLVALHKWAVHADNAAKNGEVEGSSSKTDIQFAHARMAVVADVDLLMLVDDETKASILILLQDIARDCTGGLVSDAELEQASAKLSAPAPFDQQSYDSAHAQFSAAYLLTCDPSSIAKQIHAFHISKSRPFISGRKMSAWQLIAQSAGHVEASLTVFDWKRPHYLTRLIWDHILGPGQKQNQVQNGPVQAAKERASLLRHWIAVASYLLKLKDVTAWLAICAALCSRAVARLSMTWRFVATSDRALVSTCWAPVLAKLGWSEIDAPRVKAFTDDATTVKSSINANASTSSSHDTVPYLGNATLSLHRVGPLGSASPGFFPLNEVESAAQSVVALDAQLKGLKEGTNFRQVHHCDEGIQRAFGSMLQTYCASDSDSSSYLLLSMQLETPVLGRAEKSISSQVPRQLAAAAISPLAFEDPLPNLALISVDDSASHLETTATSAQSSATITPGMRDDEEALPQRLKSRSSLTGTPLFRTRSLTAPLSTRPLKNVPFGEVLEWLPSTPIQTPALDDNLIRILPDLVLSASTDQPPSAPSSPRVGKRFSQSVSGMGSRPSSHASKRSSLPPSERNSIVEPASIPLQVSIRAASLDRLLDVLVMGVSHLTSEVTNDEAVERMGIFGPRRQRLSMDLSHHRKIFLSTYRTICSPIALFDQLRRRLFAAVDAGRDMALPALHRPSYPAWPRVQPAGTGAMQIDWDVVGKIRSGVIAVLSLWISRHSYDFVEETALYNGIHKLAEDLEASRVRNVDDMDFEKTLRSLDDLTRQLRIAVMASQSERRVSKRSSKRASANGMIATQIGNAAIDIDAASPAEVVDYLESVVRVFFDKVDEADLLQVYEMFNSRANDAAIWHVARYSEAASQPNTEEIPAANSMYKLLELLRWPPESCPLVQSLPAPIRDACAAQNLLRGWTAIQVIQEGIGLERRKSRIVKLVDALWICRARMCNSRIEDVATVCANPSLVFAEPTVASFVESVIAGSLTSSESRLFTYAWQAAAVERGTTPESLLGFAPSREACEGYRETLQRSSTPDVGWLLKSLAQAVSRPPAISREDGALLDFDKYRTVCSLIQSSVGRTKGGALDPTLVDLAGSRLSSMQQALRSVTWDRRAFKDNNAREAASASPAEMDADKGPRRPKRPLGGITQRQQEKIRRDRMAYGQIAELTKKETIATPRVEVEPVQQQGSPLASPAPPSPLLSPTIAASSEKKTRRMTALFRGAVRPMGLMSSSANQDRTTPEIPAHTYDELLSMTPASKTAYVMNCGSSRVSVWTNSQRSFVFNVSPREGGHVLLQAANGRELYDCLRAIEKASKDHAVAASRSALADGKRGANGAAAKSARSVGPPLYGSDIEVLADHYKCSVPPGLERMLQQIEARGLREQGIYRISGAKSAIEALKVSFSTMPADSVNLATGEFSDVHTIAGAIKQWFRDLPDPVIPYTAYHAIIDAERMDNDEDRLYAIRDLIWDFSKAHFELLKRICEHLALVCSEGEHNLMAPHNIGLVFGTSLLNPPPSPAAVAESFGNIGKAAHIVKILVTMNEWLFESEQELEQEAIGTEAGGTRDEAPITNESDIDGESTVAGHALDTQAEAEDDAPALPTIVEPHLSQPSDFVTIPNPTALGTSDSGMLRAVMSAQEDPALDHLERTSNGTDAKSDAAIKRARRRESVMPGMALNSPGLASKERVADLLEEEDEDDDVELVADMPTKTQGEAGGSLPGARFLASGAKNRRSRTESVYLDAREALAALQNPFDEGDEEDDEVDGADLGDESRDVSAMPAMPLVSKSAEAGQGKQDGATASGRNAALPDARYAAPKTSDDLSSNAAA